MNGEIPRAIIVTHGKLGEELVKSTWKVLGKQDGIRIISNTGLSNQALAEDIITELKNKGREKVVLFTDMPGGSCFIAAMCAAKEMPGQTIITGVNLPMLLEFFTKRDRLEFDALVEKLLATGRASIKHAP